MLIQSLFLIVSGIFWLFIFPVVFNEILISKLIIKPGDMNNNKKFQMSVLQFLGTIAYDAWKKPNLPTKIKSEMHLKI